MSRIFTSEYKVDNPVTKVEETLTTSYKDRYTITAIEGYKVAVQVSDNRGHSSFAGVLSADAAEMLAELLYNAAARVQSTS